MRNHNKKSDPVGGEGRRGRAGVLEFIAPALAMVGLATVYIAGLGHHGMFMWDEAHYAVLGRALARGEGYVEPNGAPEALRPPVLPLAVAAALRLLPGDDPDRKSLAVLIGAALLAVLVVYASARAEAGVIGGLAAALLFGTFPEVCRLASYLLTEIPLMVFYTAAVILFDRGLHHDARWFPVAWACFALAMMTRYTAVLFGPTCALLVAFCIASRDEAAIRRMRTAYFLGAPLIAAVILLPMFARAQLLFGDALIGFKMASRQLPDYSAHARMPLLHYVSILPSMIGWLPALALAAVVGGVVARRDHLGVSCLTAAVVIFAWLSQYGWKEPRLVSAALPFMAILLGTTLSRLAHSAGLRNPHAVIAAAAVLFLVGVQVDPSYRRVRAEITGSVALGYPSFLHAMDWVRGETPLTAVLMGPNCYQISWYADRSCTPLPGETRSRAAPASLRTSLAGVDYVVATSFERGQPAYVGEQFARLTSDDYATGAAWRFRDSRFSTLVVPSTLLLERGA